MNNAFTLTQCRYKIESLQLKINCTVKDTFRLFLFFFCLFQIKGIELKAQDNSLTNSSFEYMSGVPTRHSMFDDYAKNWQNALPRSVSPPDLYLNNSSSKFTSWTTVYDAVQIKDASQFHGCAFAGFFINYNNGITDPKFKEYILQRVDLKAGTTYTLMIDLAKSNLSSSNDLDFDFGIYGYTGSVPANHINYCVIQSDGTSAPLLASISKVGIGYDVRTFTISFTPSQDQEYIMFGGTGCGLNATNVGYVYFDNIRLNDSDHRVLNPEVLYVTNETRGCCYSKTKPEFKLTGNRAPLGASIQWSQKSSNPELITFTSSTDSSTNILGIGTLTPGLYEFYYSFLRGADIAIDTFQINVTAAIDISAGIDRLRTSTTIIEYEEDTIVVDANANPMCGSIIYSMNASPSWDTIIAEEYQTWWSMTRNDGSEWVFPNYCVAYNGLNEGTVLVEENRYYGIAPLTTCKQDTLFPTRYKMRNPGWHPQNSFLLAEAQDTIKFMWHVKDNCDNIYIDTIKVIQNRVSLVAPAYKCVGDTVLIHQFVDSFVNRLNGRAGLLFHWEIVSGSGRFLDPSNTIDSMHLVISGGPSIKVQLTVTDTITGASFYCIKDISTNIQFFNAGRDQIKCTTSCGRNDFIMIASPSFDTINMYDAQTWWSMIRADSTEWVFPNYCTPYNGLNEGTVFVEENMFYGPSPTFTCNQPELEKIPTRNKNPGWHPRNSFYLIKAQDTVDFIWHVKDICGVIYKDTVTVVQNRINIEAQKTCNKRSGICPGDSIWIYQIDDSTMLKLLKKPNLTFTWSKISGPGVVNFLRPISSSDSMKVSINIAGDYVIRLSVFDSTSRCTFYCQTTITVRMPAYANAGPDRSECNAESKQIFEMSATPTSKMINENCMQTYWSMITDAGEEWVFPNFCVPYNGVNEGSVYVESPSFVGSSPPLTCNQGNLATLSKTNQGWHPNNKFIFISYGTKKFIWHVKDACSGSIYADTISLSWSYNELRTDTIADLTPICSSTRLSGNISGSSGGIGGCYNWHQIDGPASIRTSDTNSNIIYLFDLDSIPNGVYTFQYTLGCSPCFTYDTVNIYITSVISSPPISLSTTYDSLNICYGDTVRVIAAGGIQYAFLVNGVMKQDFSSSNVFEYWLFDDTSTIDVIASMGSSDCYSNGDYPIIVNVQQIQVPVISGVSMQHCIGTSSSLNATCASNCKIRWYNNRDYLHSTPLNGPFYNNSGESFMISPTTSLSYFAVAFDTITGCSSMPDSIDVIVNLTPVITTDASPSGLCTPGGLVSLVGHCIQSNIIIEWYHTPVRTGIPMNAGGTPNGKDYDLFITSTDSFYGFAVNQLTGCISTFSKLIIYVLDAPTLSPFLNDSMVRCGNVPITISASITPVGVDNSVKWYLNNTADSSYFATRNPLVYLPTHPSYLYAFAINTLSGCVSTSYDSLFIDTASLPQNPISISAIPAFICNGDSSLLSVAPVDPGLEVRWFYSSSSAGMLIGSGNPITVKPLVNTTYYAYLYNPSSGCYSNTSSRTTVTVYAKPIAGVDKYACQYSTVRMSGIGSTLWSDMPGNPAPVSFSSVSSPTPTVSGLVSEGTYGVVRTNSNGCTDTAFIFVTVKPSAGLDQIACGESDVVLSGTGSVAGTWNSFVRNPIGSTLSDSLSESASVHFIASATGTFKYIYNVQGCEDTTSISLTAKPVAGIDKIICQYSNVLLSGTGAGTWSAIASNPSIVSFSSLISSTPILSGFTAFGSYNFLRTSATGCTDTVLVLVNEKPSAGVDHIVCDGGTVLLSGVSLAPGIWSSYAANPIGASLAIDSSVNAIATFSSSALGTYRYIYTVETCSDTSLITAGAKPNAGIDKSIRCYIIDTARMSAIGVGSWSLGLGSAGSATILSRTSISTKVYNFSSIGIYYLIWTNANGCSDTAFIMASDTCICPISNNILTFPASSSYCLNTGMIVLRGNTALPLSGHYLWQYDDGTGFINASGINNMQNYNTSLSIGSHLFRRIFYTSTGILCSDTSASLLIMVHDTSASILDVTICSNESFYFNGQAHTISGIYKDTLRNSLGCDSFIYLNLIINESQTEILNISICANESYNFHGLDLHTNGSYIDTLSNRFGCDSIIILNLEIRPVDTVTIYAPICAYQLYYFNGRNLNTSGLYQDTLVNTAGCDSFVILFLEVNSASVFEIVQSICNEQTYFFNGMERNSSGTYADTFANIAGCDSIVTLLLQVYASSSGSINVTICEHSSYYFNGDYLDTSGTYADTISNINGCDSIVTLVLNVALSNHEDISVSICQYETYLFNERELTFSGDYEDTFSNLAGCDSFVTLHLDVMRKSGTAIDANICYNETYYFDGLLLEVSGQYYDTLSNIHDCDSIITLNLFVAPQTDSSLEINLCNGQSYTFQGIEIRATTFISDTILNVFGCDSIFSLQVNVNNTIISNTYASICEHQSFLFSGDEKTVSGTYSDTLSRVGLCDSIAFLHLNVLPQSYHTIVLTMCEGSYYIFNDMELTTSGVYLDTFINIFGCDSFINLNLSFNSFYFISNKYVICEGSSIDIGLHHYDRTGEYEDTFVSYLLCDSIIHTSLIVQPVIFNYQYLDVCPGQTASINGRIIIIGNEASIFEDTLSSYAGCDSILVTTVNILLPTYLSIDTSICEGESFNSINYFLSSVVVDTMRSSFGCDSTITIYNIRIERDIPLMVSRDTTICRGDSVLLMANGGNDTYQWSASDPLSLPSSYNTSTLLTNPISNTLYIVFSRQCDGRLVSESVSINVQEPPKFKITNRDTCVNIGQELTLETTNELLKTDTLTWFLDGKAICLNCPNFTLIPNKAGNYLAMVEDLYGCSSMDSVNVCLTNECFENSFKIPNYITPNGDGNNDNFRFLNPENLTIVSLKIYDRWGEKIFESTAQNPEWDGTFGGRICSPGTYVYTIEAVCGMKGNIIKSGNVSILR